MAMDKGDGRVERVLRLSNESDVQNAGRQFSPNAYYNMSDSHIWYSVTRRPTKTNFNRVQRLSCCLCILCLTMVTNCMFYQEMSKSGDDVRVNLGPIEFSWKAIYIGMISSVVIFPGSVIIIQLFRKTKPAKRSGNCCNPSSSSSRQTQDADTILDGLNLADDNQTSHHPPRRTSKFNEMYPWAAANRNPIPSTSARIENSSSVSSLQDSDFYSENSADSEVFLAAYEKNASCNFRANVKYSPFLEPIDSQIFAEEYNETTFASILNNTQSGKSPNVDDTLDNSPSKEKRKKPFLLPYCFVYLAWVLLVAGSLASAACTVAYSLQWGRQDSDKWLLAFFVSFFEDVILIEPAKVAALTFISTIFFKTYAREEDLDSTVERDIYYNENLLDESDLKEKEENPETKEKIKLLRQKEVKMWDIIKQLLFYIVFLVLLWFIAYTERDPGAYFVHKSIKDTLIEKKEFNKISGGFSTFYDWLNVVVVPSLYPDRNYNGDLLRGTDQQLFGDLAAYRLGSGRLRQLRVNSVPCLSPQRIPNINITKSCYPPYSRDNEETLNYGRMNETGSGNHSDVWVYKTQEELENLPINGNRHTYSGGGYVAELGNSQQEAKEMVQYLINSQWLDRQTRAVFIEFNLYYSNVDLLSSVIVLLERLQTGGCLTSYQFSLMRLSSLKGTFWFVTLAIQLCFVAVLLYYFCIEVKSIWKLRLRYFFDFWNLIEIAKVVCCIIGSIFYILMTLARNNSVDKLSIEGNQLLISFQTVHTYDEIYRSTLALVVFFSTLRLWHFLRFYKRMALLYTTLKVTKNSLIGFTIMILFILLSYAEVFYIAFGSNLRDYNSFGNSLATVYQMGLSAGGYYKELDQLHRILGPIAFLSFSLISYIFMTNFFISILIYSFELIKSENDRVSNEHEVLDFLLENLKNMLGIQLIISAFSKNKKSDDNTNSQVNVQV